MEQYRNLPAHYNNNGKPLCGCKDGLLTDIDLATCPECWKVINKIKSQRKPTDREIIETLLEQAIQLFRTDDPLSSKIALGRVELAAEKLRIIIKRGKK